MALRARPPRRRQDPRVIRAYAVLAATTILAGLCVLVALYPKSGCFGALRYRPVPPNWHDWPELPHLGGFRILGRTSGPLGRPEVLVEDGVCAEEGLVVGDNWGFPLSPEQSHVRRRLRLSNEYAIELKFLPRDPRWGYSRDVTVGFSRSAWFALHPRDLPPILALHLFAIGGMSAAIALARKKLRRAEDLRDPARFVEGTYREGTRASAARRADRVASVALGATTVLLGCLLLAEALLMSGLG
jgi:hypothetical protein